jgi:hypothetical protein
VSLTKYNTLAKTDNWYLQKDPRSINNDRKEPWQKITTRY